MSLVWQTLSDFQYIDSSGRDQGSNVRKKSQSLVALVNDKERIQEVRQKAAANRDKWVCPSNVIHVLAYLFLRNISAIIVWYCKPEVLFTYAFYSCVIGSTCTKSLQMCSLWFSLFMLNSSLLINKGKISFLLVLKLLRYEFSTKALFCTLAFS